MQEQRDPGQAANTASLKARAASGVIWSLIDSISQQVLSLAIFVVLGRLLTPELFGIVSTALVFVFLMRSTILNAIASSLVTLPRPEQEDYDTAFWLLAGVSVTAVLALNLLARPLADLYRIPEFESVIRAMSLMVLAFGLSYGHYAWARRNFQFREIAFRNIAGLMAGGGVGVAFALAGYGLTALVLNQLVTAFVVLVISWISTPWHPHFTFSRPRARRLLETALPQGLTQSVQFALQNFDTALVTFLLGPLSGGLYAAAKRITLAVQLAAWQPVAAVVLPAFTEVSGDRDRLRRVTLRTAALVMAITAPVLAAISMTAPALVSILFGGQWSGAAPILSILCGLGIAVPSTGVLHTLLFAQRRSVIALNLTLVQAFLSIGGVAILGKHGAEAIAYCMSVPTLLVYWLSFVAVQRLMGLSLRSYLLAVGPPLLCAALMAVIMASVPDVGAGKVLQLIFVLALGGVSYAVTMYITARDTFREAAAIAMLFPSKWQTSRG